MLCFTQRGGDIPETGNAWFQPHQGRLGDTLLDAQRFLPSPVWVWRLLQQRFLAYRIHSSNQTSDHFRFPVWILKLASQTQFTQPRGQAQPRVCFIHIVLSVHLNAGPAGLRVLLCFVPSTQNTPTSPRPVSGPEAEVQPPSRVLLLPV